MFRKRNIIVTLLVALLVALSFANSAFAYCGPKFTSKRQAIAWLKTDAGKKYLPSMKVQLVKYGYVHKDQDVMAFLEGSDVVFVITPKSYKLKSNTYCKGTTYLKYNGLLLHSKKGALAIKKQKSAKKLGKPKVTQTSRVVKTEQVQEPQPDGSINIVEVKTIEVTTTTTQKVRRCDTYTPFMKGYCRNVGKGNSYQECKTSTQTTTKKETHEERKPLGKIPPPPVATPTPVTPTPTPVTPKCPDGRQVPPSGDCDRAPSLSVVWPPHVYDRGGNQAIFIEVSDPDGDVVSNKPNIIASENTKQYAHVSSIVPSTTRWDGTPCPNGVSCFRGILWGDMAGFVDLTASVTVNGKTVSVPGRVQVYHDEFGDAAAADSFMEPLV